MNCKQARRRISDAALGALPPEAQAGLEVHLAACEGCRAALAAERKLFAAMDAGLREGLEAQPAPGFAAAVRRRIAARRAQPRWLAAWAPVTAAGLAVILVLAVWLATRPAPQPPVARKEPVPAGVPEAAPHGLRPDAPAATVAVRAPRRAQPRATASAKLEVLVPPGQWEAVRQLYAAAMSGRLDAESLLRPVPETLSIEELRTRPLVIAPLSAEDGSPPERPRDSR